MGRSWGQAVRWGQLAGSGWGQSACELVCVCECVCEHEKDRLRVIVHMGSQLLVSAEGTRAGAQQGGQPGPPLSSEVEVSLGVWGQMAIFKGWGHAGACLNPCADFLWGLIPRSAHEPLEKAQSS